MSKTLSNILTVFKVLKVIAKVVFILCIVGGVGCAIGLVALPFADIAEEFTKENLVGSAAYAACITGIIVCAGEAVFAYLAEKYFANILDEGTPFTHTCAKETWQLGLTSVIVSVAISVTAGVVLLIFNLFSQDVSGVDVDATISLSTGLFLLFMSLIFKHGAEVKNPDTEDAKEEQEEQEETKDSVD